LVLENTSEPVSDQHSAPAIPSSEASAPQDAQSLRIPESENEKHEFVGNPVRDPSYWVRRSGKRVAEFHLATHTEKEKTLYHRIRAFDKQAERARDTVRKGQTDIEVVAYGPKYWPVTRKTKDGREKQQVVQGYYAGFVNVPKRYRGEQPPSTQQPLE
jgi:single-stranded DNA-binding protein